MKVKDLRGEPAGRDPELRRRAMRLTLDGLAVALVRRRPKLTYDASRTRVDLDADAGRRSRLEAGPVPAAQRQAADRPRRRFKRMVDMLVRRAAAGRLRGRFIYYVRTGRSGTRRRSSAITTAAAHG